MIELLKSEQFVIDGFNGVKTFIQYLSAKVKKSTPLTT